MSIDHGTIGIPRTFPHLLRDFRDDGKGTAALKHSFSGTIELFQRRLIISVGRWSEAHRLSGRNLSPSNLSTIKITDQKTNPVSGIQQILHQKLHRFTWCIDRQFLTPAQIRSCIPEPDITKFSTPLP